MPFCDLDHMTLNEFIESARGDENSFWFFQHIPKTAGSSFSTELHSRKWPYANISVDYTDMATPHEEKLERAVSVLLAKAQLTQFRSASGHLKLDQVGRLSAAIPDCRVITFLRSPVARVISDFRYQRTSMHPPYQQFIERFPTLESYVDSPESQNKMADFLLGRLEGVTAADAVDSVGRSHAFIGLLEMYPMSFNIAFRLMGQDGLWPTTHKRKTPNEETTRVDVTPQLRAMIWQTNPLDQAIYDAAHATLMRHREAFKALEAIPARA